MKLTLNKQSYKTQGISGIIATILAIPAMVLAFIGAICVVLPCAILMIPSFLIGMLQAKKIND